MNVFAIVLALCCLVVAYWRFANWMICRVVAWNAVMAVTLWKHMDEADKKRFELAALQVFQRGRRPPEGFAKLSGAVRFAFMAQAMAEAGISSGDPRDQPFRPIRSPFMADAARHHIAKIRKVIEPRYEVTLLELDEPERE